MSLRIAQFTTTEVANGDGTVTVTQACNHCDFVSPAQVIRGFSRDHRVIHNHTRRAHPRAVAQKVS